MLTKSKTDGQFQGQQVGAVWMATGQPFTPSWWLALASRRMTGDERIEKNVQKAVEIYQTLADAGAVEGMFELGLCYRTGVGVAKNLELAGRLLDKAAAGDSADQIRLGKYCFKQGKDDFAVAMFQKAAMQQNAEAMYLLSVMYANGWGVEKDILSSLIWRTKAVERAPILRKLLQGQGAVCGVQ
jgi:TPR repeat protein